MAYTPKAYTAPNRNFMLGQAGQDWCRGTPLLGVSCPRGPVDQVRSLGCVCGSCAGSCLHILL